MVNNLRCILSLHFKLVIQVVCTRGSNTFTAGMAMEYSHMQEMSDLYQAKDRKLINYYRLWWRGGGGGVSQALVL